MQKFDIHNFVIDKVQHITLYKSVCPICGYKNYPKYLLRYCPDCGEDLWIEEFTELVDTN